MADTKVSAMTPLAELSSDDVFPVIDSPSGTPANRTATAAVMKTFMQRVVETSSSIQALFSTAPASLDIYPIISGGPEDLAGVAIVDFSKEPLFARRYGAIGNGITDDKTAIDNALLVAAVNGGRVVLDGGLTYSSTPLAAITSDNVSIGSYDEATLQLSGTGTLLTFSAATTLIRGDCGLFGNLQLRRAAQEWDDLTDTTSIALLLQNCYRGQWFIDIKNFWLAIDMVGDAKGCVYNKFNIRQLITNRFSLRLRRVNVGWCNENNFYGGNWSNLLTGSATAEHITWDFGDGNHFWGCAFEGKPTRVMTLSADATNSDFNGCRFEVIDGGLEMIDSTGSNITFNGCQNLRTNNDVIIRSGAGQHVFIGGSNFQYLDENVPSVVVAIGNGTANDRPPIPFCPLNLAPDGSAEHLTQPTLVGGNDIGLLPAGWVWTRSTWNSGIIGSAESTIFKDGSQSLKLVNTDAQNVSVGFELTGLTSGQDYTLSFLMRCTTIATNAIRVRVGSTLSLNEDLNASFTPDDTWINYSTVFTAGAISRFIYLLFNTSSAFTCYLDAVAVNRGYHPSYRFTPKQITEEGGTIIGNIGFYGTQAISQQTGVAVSAAGVHAALVNLGLITA